MLLATTNSSAQNSENSNPYAIFGRTPYVAGAKDAGADGEKVFVIENFAEGSKVARIEHNPQTGRVRLLNKHGKLLKEKLLKACENGWPTQDRFAQKYYSLSPYSYAAGNPIRYIDINGDSIYVAEQYREQYNATLKNVFGENAKDFNYTESGMLVYSGNSKNLNKSQRKIMKGMSSVMNESMTTEIQFENTSSIKDNAGNTININLKNLGSDGITLLASENNISRNYVIVNPNSSSSFSVNVVTPAYYDNGPINPGGPARFYTASVSTNPTDIVFHELGHVIHQGQTQDHVIDFNNVIRRQIGLPIRPYDETHNRNVRYGMY